MARRRQRHALGRPRFDRLKRMTEVAFGAFESHVAADGLLHLRLVAGDATRRARLLAHRLSELIEEVRAGFRSLAGLVADHAALRALTERFFIRSEHSPGVVVVVGHVSLVVERRWRLRLLTGFLRLLGVELGVDDFTVETEHGLYRTRILIFLL